MAATQPALTLIVTEERPVGALAARYVATYAHHPGKAAEAVRRARAQAQQARQEGDREAATAWEEVGDALEAELGRTGRCRRCGRTLRHPSSVAAGIGPECVGKER